MGNIHVNKKKKSNIILSVNEANMILSYDVQNIICSYIYDLREVINFYNLSKKHQNCIYITDLCNRNSEYLQKITQKVLKQQKFKYIEKLNASYNKYVYNVNHLKNTLKVLYCAYDSGIDQKGISDVQLQYLNANFNTKIKNVNHMKHTLEILFCIYDCGIDQKGISELNLKKLDCYKNKKIINNQIINDGSC